MRTPPGGLRPALAVLAIVAATLLAPGRAVAAKCNDAWNLHPGNNAIHASCGQRVKDLQWLLGGHEPYALTAIKPTFKYQPNGQYGARTASSVKAMKWRAGYPQAGQCKQKANMASSTLVGPQFLAILENKAPRPLCWVGLAAARVKGIVRQGATPTALRIKALELSQLGVTESPNGSNRGPRISYTSQGFGPYQGATGAYGLAWCSSFGDWAKKSVTGRGFGSSNDAFVPTVALYARDQGWLAAKPKVGSYVVFLNENYTLAGALNGAYHIGFVVKVTASGVQTIEGNYSNGVHEVFRYFANNQMVYIDFPGIA